MALKPIGIDNAIFTVGDLDEAIRFYQPLGFALKFHVQAAGVALFEIGRERPGLLLRRGTDRGSGCLWVEVADAAQAADAIGAIGLPLRRISTATGETIEIDDPWGNVVGFADYSKRPDLARPRPSSVE